MLFNIFIILIFFLSICLPEGIAASKREAVSRGNNLFYKEDFASSIEEYKKALEKDPESDVVNFNLGTAYYKKGEYQNALTHLQKGLLSDNLNLKEGVHYNLGNTYYKFGISKEGENLKEAVSLAEEALKRYDDALKINSKDADAKFNKDFVQKELERLKEKLRYQQEKQSQQNESSEQSQQQGGSDSSKENQSHAQPKENKDKNHTFQNNQSQDQERIGKEDNQKKSDEGSKKEDLLKQNNENNENLQNSDYNKHAQQNQNENSALSNPEDLTIKEAQMILENYKQVEEPRRLFPIQRKIESMETNVPLKDW